MHRKTADEAKQMLEMAITRAGGLKAYAGKLGVSCAFISPMRGKGLKRITGVVAADLGLRTVNEYEFTGPVLEQKQDKYVNERRKWAADHGNPLERSKNMRVTGK